MDEAAEMGNVDAKVMIGKSKLLGNYYQQVGPSGQFFIMWLLRGNSGVKTPFFCAPLTPLNWLDLVQLGDPFH